MRNRIPETIWALWRTRSVYDGEEWYLVAVNWSKDLLMYDFRPGDTVIEYSEKSRYRVDLKKEK